MIQIQFTASSLEEAQRMATLLVEKGLFACATCIPNVVSVYRWEGRVETAVETKLLLKTSERHYPEVEALLQRESGYDVPEILFTRIDGGSASYLDWLNSFGSVQEKR